MLNKICFLRTLSNEEGSAVFLSCLPIFLAKDARGQHCEKNVFAISSYFKIFVGNQHKITAIEKKTAIEWAKKEYTCNKYFFK